MPTPSRLAAEPGRFGIYAITCNPGGKESRYIGSLSRVQLKLMQLHINQFQRRQNGGKNLIGMHGAGFA